MRKMTSISASAMLLAFTLSGCVEPQAGESTAQADEAVHHAEQGHHKRVPVAAQDARAHVEDLAEGHPPGSGGPPLGLLHHLADDLDHLGALGLKILLGPSTRRTQSEDRGGKDGESEESERMSSHGVFTFQGHSIPAPGPAPAPGKSMRAPETRK